MGIWFRGRTPILVPTRYEGDAFALAAVNLCAAVLLKLSPSHLKLKCDYNFKLFFRVLTYQIWLKFRQLLAKSFEYRLVE